MLVGGTVVNCWCSVSSPKAPKLSPATSEAALKAALNIENHYENNGETQRRDQVDSQPVRNLVYWSTLLELSTYCTIYNQPIPQIC